jgi:hypothetical protein
MLPASEAKCKCDTHCSVTRTRVCMLQCRDAYAYGFTMWLCGGDGVVSSIERALDDVRASFAYKAIRTRRECADDE